MRRIFNASNVFGAIAFFDVMVLVPGTVEENPMLSIALTALFAVCAYLADRESGKRK